MRRVFSAGGAVFKRQNSKTVWLIIKPRPSKLFPNKRYQLPKGQLEEGENEEEAAIREVYEETGIRGKIIKKVGYSKFPMKIGEENIFKIIAYFLMEYSSGDLTVNKEVEELYWLGFEEAKKRLTFSDEKKILAKAYELLSTISPGGDATSGDLEGGGSN